MASDAIEVVRRPKFTLEMAVIGSLRRRSPTTCTDPSEDAVRTTTLIVGSALVVVIDVRRFYDWAVICSPC